MTISTNHRYSLQQGSKKYTCPRCEEKKEFKRYIDNATGEQLADDVGKCERIFSCGYHKPPKDYFTDNPDKKVNDVEYKHAEKPQIPDSYLSQSIVEESFTDYQSNNFVHFLYSLFGVELATVLMENYLIGSATPLIKKYNLDYAKKEGFEGATVFYQIDEHDRVRQAKVMQYNPVTGKKQAATSFSKSINHHLGAKHHNFRSCFFGQHMIANSDPEIPIAIVESEKTAILMTPMMPDYIWIATGSIYGCKWRSEPENILPILSGRKVVLYPDLGGFEIWQQLKDSIMKYGAKSVVVDDLLERSVTNEIDKSQGYDIADYAVLKTRCKTTGKAIDFDGNYLMV